MIAADLDGDALNVSLDPASGPVEGDIGIASDGSFIYTPDTAFDAVDSFRYWVDDGSCGFASGSLTVTINSVSEGSAAADEFAGDGAADLFNGGGGKDRLEGSGGNDVLDGDGSDVLIGGGGSDRFIFDRGNGRDTITDFQQGRDKIVVSGGANTFADLQITQIGADVRILIGNTRVTVEDDQSAKFTASDFIF